MGSRREARRAGKKAARNATNVSVAAATTMVAGSLGSKPNKNWRRNLESSSAAEIPMANPKTTTVENSRSTMFTT